MFVNDRVRVTKLERHAPGDRSAYVDREGSLTMRLNVPWEADLGALWRVRFEDGSEAVFAESEIVVLDASGHALPSEIPGLQESWGDAPRAGSMPFRRRLTSSSSQAILAFLVFLIAGLLLVGAGLASNDLRISAAGGAFVLVGLGAAAVLVS